MSSAEVIVALLQRQFEALQANDWTAFRDIAEQTARKLADLDPDHLERSAAEATALRDAAVLIGQTLDDLRVRIERHALQLRSPAEGSHPARIIDRRG